MAFWEFLIQKEGDRSWLPLESPDVEVLEGRYRVVARSSRVTASVEICVSHIDAEAHPPKQRIQKRLSQTNRDGLVVVIPFTRLDPGVWELRCTGDLMSDMIGDGWRYAVTLQVLPHHSDQLGDWDVDDPDNNATPLIQPSPLDDHPEDSDGADTGEYRSGSRDAVTDAATDAAIQGAQANGLPNSEAIAAPEIPNSPEIPNLPEIPTTPQIPSAPDRAIAFPNTPAISEPPAISVTPIAAPKVVSDAEVPSSPQIPAAEAPVVDAIAADAATTPITPTAPDSGNSDDTNHATDAVPDPFPMVELVLAQNLYMAVWGDSLRLTGQIEPLEAEATGALLTMPTACLHITLRDPQTAEVLSTVQQPLESGSLPYPFTVDLTIPDLQDTRLLLGEVFLTQAVGATQAEALATSAFTLTADLNHLLEAIANDFSSEVYPPLEFVEQSVESSLDFSLLNLVNSSSASQAADLALPMADLAEEPALIADGVQLQAGSDWVEIPIQQPTSLPDDAAAIADEPLEWDAAAMARGDRPSLLVPTANVPQEQAFQSLNLQNRFLSRLSALASDAELSGLLQADAPPLGLDATLASQEFVLQDDVPLPPVRTSVSAQPSKKVPDAPPVVLADDEPVPTPTLTLPSAELISGKQVHVTVTLPDLLPRFYVKLWVRDRQTQTTLDGPRWVMHFNPDGRGSQQSQTIMTIPFGCLEAQFEAIAIEMATQRESHKVTIPRSVIPSDLPTMSIDELEL